MERLDPRPTQYALNRSLQEIPSDATPSEVEVMVRRIFTTFCPGEQFTGLNKSTSSSDWRRRGRGRSQR